MWVAPKAAQWEPDSTGYVMYLSREWGTIPYIGEVLLLKTFGMRVCVYGLSVANVFSLFLKNTSDLTVVPSANRIK